MAEALLHVVSKIGSTLTEEATKGVLNKLYKKVKYLKELPGKQGK
jgi:disease resistance protein RPM1